MRRWIVLLALAAACDKLEEGHAEIKEEQCAGLPYAGSYDSGYTEEVFQVGGPRFFRYYTDVDFGDPPPSSVSSKSSSASRSYMTRGYVTKRQAVPFQIASLLMVLGMVAGGVGLIAIVGVITPDNTPGKRVTRRQMSVVVGVGLAAAAVLGYMGGSRYVLENATPKEVDIVADGKTYHLPPWSYVDVRVSGDAPVVETRADGQTLERVALQPDANVGEQLMRVFIGRGRFIYNVCGVNHYSINTAHYGN